MPKLLIDTFLSFYVLLVQQAKNIDSDFVDDYFTGSWFLPIVGSTVTSNFPVHCN